MFWTVNQVFSKSYTKSIWYSYARANISLYTQLAAESALENFLMTQYKKPLKLICLEILNNCKLQDDGAELIVTTNDKKYADLASLITFGTGKVKGSKILYKALTLQGE